MRLAAITLSLAMFVPCVAAQDDTLRVLDHSPENNVDPSAVISVMFDRPVAGRLDETVPAARILRFSPAIRGRAFWRDPITVVFLPDAPIAPGTKVRVTVDTGFAAIDGARLARPYSFELTAPGPRLLASTIGTGERSAYSPVPLSGKLSFLYSAPVDAARIARFARLDFSGCERGGRVFATRVVGVHALVPGSELWSAYYYQFSRDSLAARFLMVVELETAQPLPEECIGTASVPMDGADPKHHVDRWSVHTPDRFHLRALDCEHGGSCVSLTQVRVAFTATVRREDVRRHLRILPATEFSFEDPGWGTPRQGEQWQLKAALKPHTKYSFVVDSEMRDLTGRPIVDPRTLTVATGDYPPVVSYPRGLLAMPRSAPLTIPFYHQNVRTVRVIYRHLPESARARMIGAATFGWQVDPDALDLADDAVEKTVTLRGAFNVGIRDQLPLEARFFSRKDGLMVVSVGIASVITEHGDSAVRPGSIDDPGNRGRALPFAILQVTDIAVHVRHGKQEDVAFVTGLRDNAPRAGALVRHLDWRQRVLAQGVTDSTGVAILTRVDDTSPPVGDSSASKLWWARNADFFDARLGDDRVIAGYGVRMIGFGADVLSPTRLGGRYEPEQSDIAAAIFPERGAYRPGQMVYLHAIVRRGLLGALEAAPRERVRVIIAGGGPAWNASESTIHDTTLTTDGFGALTDSLRLSDAAEPGSYTIELKVRRDTTWEFAAVDSLRIAEYRAPTFLADATTDSAPRFTGDTARVAVTARYLFGAPMARARVQWAATIRTVSPWDVRIPGAEGWAVGEWVPWNERENAPQTDETAGEDSLDAHGALALRVPIAGVRSGRPGRVDISIGVVDVNDQMVTTSVSIPVHPARVYVLARRQGGGWFVDAGSPWRTEIRTVRPDGSEARGVPVIVRVVKREYDGEWTDSLVRTDTVAEGASPAIHQFTPATSGVYELRLSAEDGHGGTANTTFEQWVTGKSWWWGNNDPFQLQLLADGREYTDGETAKVVVQSPFDSADAWVTVERERTLERRKVAMHAGANVVEIPIRGADVPNVFVSAFLLRRGTPIDRPDSSEQLLRLGYVELRVSARAKRLHLSLAPARAEYRPGDTAAVRVRVRDATGQGVPSEVTLWAVDQGVLALTDYRTPDPIARLYEPRALGTRYTSSLPMTLTTDPFLQIRLASPVSLVLQEVVVTGAATLSTSENIQIRGLKSLDRDEAKFGYALAGRAAAAAAPRVTLRTEFRTTAFYLGAVRTNASGDAEVRAKLPDDLTTYRVMALAVDSGGRAGSADTTMLATRELVIRPSLPRFVRPADSLRGGATVNLRSGAARDVRVVIAGSGLGVRGDSTQEIGLAEGKGGRALFPLVVPRRDLAGSSVVVRLDATDGANADAVESVLPVRPDYTPRARAALGAVSDSADVVLDLPRDIDADRSTLSVRFGVTPLATILAANKWFRVYPYYCTEQIASGGRVLLAAWMATRGTANALEGDPRAELQALADQLVRRIRPDGGIKYWDDYEWTTPWLTVHAARFLVDAKAQGIHVDDDALERIAGYVQRFAATPIDTIATNGMARRERTIALGDRVAALEYLRRIGRPLSPIEDNLLALRSMMAWEDRLRLAELLAPRADRVAAARAIVDTVWMHVTVRGRRVDLPDSLWGTRLFPSGVAPAARLLTATLALRPSQPAIGGLIETILQQGRAEGSWAWSTQDYASAVMALAELAERAPRARTIHLASGATTLFSGSIGPSDSTPERSLRGILEERPDGRTRLRLRVRTDRAAVPVYFVATVIEVPRVPPVTPDAQGIVVERWYENIDDGRPIVSARAGEMVRVRLRITVPAARQFVALEDELPAGLEPVDLTLHTSSTIRPFVKAADPFAPYALNRGDDPSDWRRWLYGNWDDGWWSPWDHKAIHDDRVTYFARMLWKGTYTTSYVARATTTGNFSRPPAHAEEMYNAALQGRSDGGRFEVGETRP
jgi:uncharacterized protein YfaS (alpha-2-macroglobulin family)